MNRKQLMVLLMGIALVVLSELFPHWYYLDNETSHVRSAGYHFRTTEPPKKTTDELRTLFAIPDGYTRPFPDFVQLKVNGNRLRIQELTIALFAFALFIFWKTDSSKKERALGTYSFVLSVLLLALLLLDVSIKGR